MADSPAVRWAQFAREYAITAAVALVVFLVAYDNGGFAESTRGIVGIGVWWVIILVVAFGFAPRGRIPTGALVTGGLLAGFGFLTLLSAFWAADAAGAYLEFARVALYLGVFALVAIGSNRSNIDRWVDGLALGLVAVMVVALISRLFPGSFPARGLPASLPSGATRLAFPVGYWNGLAILLALAIPLLLRIAVREGGTFVRSLALVPVPAIAAVIYLASSRTGVVTAVAGSLAFLLFTSRRWTATGALVVCAASSIAAILALLNRDALVNGPLDSEAASSQGQSATLIIAGVCVLTGLLFGVGLRAMVRTPRLAVPSVGSCWLSRPAPSSSPSPRHTRFGASTSFGTRRSRQVTSRRTYSARAATGGGSSGPRRSRNSSRSPASAGEPGATRRGGSSTGRFPCSCRTRTRCTSRCSASLASLAFCCSSAPLLPAFSPLCAVSYGCRPSNGSRPRP